jgi:hypothetical protein
MQFANECVFREDTVFTGGLNALPNDISTLAGTGALRSRAARFHARHSRRPAPFEISVETNRIEDRVHNSLFLSGRERGDVSQPPTASEPKSVVGMM